MQRSRIQSLILLFFFLSGMTGLIYEILWTRLITGIIGTAPFAVSIVLTVFMGGLGLGSWIAGKHVDRIDRPGRLIVLYGVLEIAIGVYGVLFPLFLAGFKPVYSMLYDVLFGYTVVYHLLTFVGCALLLLLPVVCMGATLPILSRFSVTGLAQAGRRLGLLYGINTVGAAAGALLCGFWLIRYLGMWGTLSCAIGLNILIGGASVIAGRGFTASPLSTVADSDVRIATEETGDVNDTILAVTALVVFGISGFCSMSYEVIWTRLLGLIVGPTTYSFTVVLVTFITGLGIGSVVFGYIADRAKSPLTVLLFTQTIAGLAVIVVSQLLGNSQIFFAKLIFSFKGNFTLLTILKTAALFAFMFVPTFFLGATFPLVLRIYARSIGRLGRSVGEAYVVNTAGSVLGSFSAGFIIIQLLGKEGGITAVAVLQFMTALVFAVYLYFLKRRSAKEFAPIAVLAVLGLMLSVMYPRWNREMLSTGRYHRSYEVPEQFGLGWFNALFFGTEILSHFESGEVVYFGDGIGGFTTVKRQLYIDGFEEYSLYNSGKSDASIIGGDMCTQTLLAHLPLMFHRDPDDVLVIGLASGITAGEVLNYPVKRLDVVEINRQVIKASDFFRQWNGNVLDDKRTNLFIQDCRAHIALTDRTYDIIISEPSNPWMAGLAALFTRDFFELARDRLKKGGMYVQWIHGYQIDWESFALIGRTFVSVFPDCALVETGNGVDYLLIGFTGEEGFDEERARENLQYAARSTNVDFRDHRVLYPFIVNEYPGDLFGKGVINTDASPTLEFAAPKLMNIYDPVIQANITTKHRLKPETERIAEFMKRTPGGHIDYTAYILSFYGLHSKYADLFEIDGFSAEERECFTRLVESYSSRYFIPDFSFIADEDVRTASMKAQVEAMRGKIGRSPAKVRFLFHLGKLAYETGLYDDAETFYSNALDIEPGVKMAHYNIGIIHVAEKRYEQAEEHFLKEIKVNPEYLSAYNSLGNVLYLTGKLDDALTWYSKALTIDPEFYKAHMNLGVILKKLGRTEEGEAHIQEAERIRRKTEGIFK